MPKIPSDRTTFVSAVKRVVQMILGHSFMTNLAAFCIPLYTLQIFDRVITTGSYESLWMLALGALIISTSGLLFEQLRRKTLVNFSHYLDQQVGGHVNAEIRRGFAGKNLYRKVKLFNQHLSSGAVASILDLLWLPISAVIIFLLSPVLGLFMLSVNLCFCLIVYAKFKQQKPSLDEGLIYWPEKTQRWLNSTNTLEHWEQAQPPVDISNSQRHGLLSDMHSSLRTLYQLGTPTIGAILLLQNSLSPGGFIAALIISARAIAPFDMLFANSTVLSLGKQIVIEVCDYFDQLSQRKSAGYSGATQGLIELKNLSVDDPLNPQHKTVLSNISLQASPGEITALVGSTGAGQSDVIKLLLGEHSEQSGDCLIDGKRRNDWCSKSLQREIALAGEAVHLPKATILQLVSRFAAVNETQAIQAAQVTGLNQRLVELNIAYDFTLTDKARSTAIGVQLERLISLTALVASEAKIVLLENPESYCSVLMLNQLQHTLQFLQQQNRCVILTTNSKQLIKLAQRTYLFENGAVVPPSHSLVSAQRVA
ncbi:ATP-binding cassette domain-containing protein [Porticoccaceae bacterium]|nr:ATP-binding cassette domain-containing protein [Porticoccaceae bacterium]